MLLRTWDSDSLLRSVGWLRFQNFRDRHIYIRPKGEHPLSLLDDLTYETMWPTHPYGFQILGTKDTVSALSAEDLKQLHTRAYFPGNCVIAAAGSAKRVGSSDRNRGRFISRGMNASKNFRVGRVLTIVSGGRDDDEGEAANGPPWPLTKTELTTFVTRHGLVETSFEDYVEQPRDEDPTRRFRATYRRP